MRPRAVASWARCAGGALLALSLAACGDSAPPRPRLVVLYAPCSVNRDFLSPYGPARDLTPALERFARASAVFQRHLTESGQSGISYASLFTGSQADVHGVYRHPRSPNPEALQITELFRDAGYETFFWSGQQVASAQYDYGRGVRPENVHQVTEIRGYTATGDEFASILRRLREDPDYEAFVQVNLTLTHNPYVKWTSDERRQQFLRDHPGRALSVSRAEALRLVRIYDRFRLALQWNLAGTVARLEDFEDPQFRLLPGDVEKLAQVLELYYAAAIEQLDRYFGLFVDSIDDAGLADETLLAFTADHGEVLYRPSARFQWTHGLALAPEVLTVPLIVRGAGVQPGPYAGVSRSIDVLPTLAGLCGIPLPANAPVQGVDLSRALRGEADPPALTAFVHTTTIGEPLRTLFVEGGELTPWEAALRLVPREDVALCWVGARAGDLMVKKVFDGEEWRFEAFDLSVDPREERNRFDPANPRHRELAAELERYRERLIRAATTGQTVDEADRRNLEALGYLESGDESDG